MPQAGAAVTDATKQGFAAGGGRPPARRRTPPRYGVTPAAGARYCGAMDERVTRYLREAESYRKRLNRFAADLDAAQLQWTPPSISNGIGWLVRHCADEFWFCYGQLSGARVPANLNQSGFPVPAAGFRTAAGRPARWGVLSFDFDRDAAGPGPTGADHAAYLDRAWQTLRRFLTDHYAEWSAQRYFNWSDRECSGWWFLDHFLLDVAWHAGQAGYLRKLLPAAA